MQTSAVSWVLDPLVHMTITRLGFHSHNPKCPLLNCTRRSITHPQGPRSFRPLFGASGLRQGSILIGWRALRKGIPDPGAFLPSVGKSLIRAAKSPHLSGGRSRRAAQLDCAGGRGAGSRLSACSFSMASKETGGRGQTQGLLILGSLKRTF